MHKKELPKTIWGLVMMAALTLQPLAALAQESRSTQNNASRPLITIAPRSSDQVANFTHSAEGMFFINHQEKLDLLRHKIKYVFVLFQENRSFDFYFGTYPGAVGLFSQPASQTPGIVQPIVLANGNVGTISPFLIPQSITDVNGDTVLLYPEDTDSVNHGHTAMDQKSDFNSNWVAQNDRYAFVQEGLSLEYLSPDGTTYTGPAPTEEQVQMGELVVSHVDCDTVPFLWSYADRFTLFDNFLTP